VVRRCQKKDGGEGEVVEGREGISGIVHVAYNFENQVGPKCLIFYI